MELLTYIKDTSRLDSLAKRLSTSPQYLRQIATKFRGRTCSPKLALRIEEQTDGVVPKWTIRPDIWPELVQKQQKPRKAA
jgi:DNA-binding transcriptional regulator YdaS (Cro superfamily)